MALYPDTIVSAAGDGEVELAFKNFGPPFADYSPFAIAEFRDWIRGEGLYAAGQPFARDAYLNAPRYRGDESPGIDSNRDGHTLNGDFNTNFDNWILRYFDWSLADTVDSDPKAIPAPIYTDPGFNPFPDAGAADSMRRATRRPSQRFGGSSGRPFARCWCGSTTSTSLSG